MSPPGSSAHGILQTGILEWVAMPSSRGSSRPKDQTHVSFIGMWVLYYYHQKWGEGVFIFRPSTDWMRPIYIMKSNLLEQSALLRVYGFK